VEMLKELYNFDEIMRPFWESNIMYDESVLMLSQNGKPAEASLLFKASKIMTVRNSHLNINYIEGEDWTYEDDVLRLTDKSKAKFMTLEEIYPLEAKEGWTFPKIGGGNILVKGINHFHNIQLSVTYLHVEHKWTGYRPVFEGEKLSKTLSKLKKSQDLKVTLYGDSISIGYDTSGFTDTPPYQPDWGKLLVRKLQAAYTSKIEFLNSSKGGESSGWGLENIEELVSKKIPDMVILAFGMNDGTGRILPESFKNNISLMMENVRKYNSDVEFILITPMLPNRLAEIPGQLDLSFWGEQENYKKVLETFVGKSVAVADMTSVHKTLLKRKRYCDISGNNVNHPNDFLSRWYAQVISAMLINVR